MRLCRCPMCGRFIQEGVASSLLARKHWILEMDSPPGKPGQPKRRIRKLGPFEVNRELPALFGAFRRTLLQIVGWLKELGLLDRSSVIDARVETAFSRMKDVLRGRLRLTDHFVGVGREHGTVHRTEVSFGKTALVGATAGEVVKDTYSF
jgi:hypothetical protein